MGFRDLITFNKSMLGKQAWRLFQHPQAIWSRLFKGLYFRYSSFQSATSGHRPSWGWQSLLKGRDVITPKLRWLVGDGTQIHIRTDNWLPQGQIGGLPADGEPELVADLIDSQNSEWKSSCVTSFFDAQVSTAILNTPINPSLHQNQLVWTETPSGTYSVKSCHHYLSSQSQTIIHDPSSSYTNPPLLWRRIWNMHTVPKIKVFLWLACKNALATKHNLKPATYHLASLLYSLP